MKGVQYLDEQQVHQVNPEGERGKLLQNALRGG